MSRRLAAGTPLTHPARNALVTVEILPPGAELRLTCGQLDRPDYEQVQAVFDRIAGGGRWHRTSGTFAWDSDRAGDLEAALKAVLDAGVLPPDPKRTDGWFATPAFLARQLAEVALELPGWYGAFSELRVLEPSAGEGALADALHLEGNVPAGNIRCVEPDPWRAAVLRGKGYPTVEGRFQDWLAEAKRSPVDLILMNPPFTEPGDSRAWVEHLQLAWQLVDRGGRLVAVVPASLEWAGDKRVERLRWQLQGYRADWWSLDEEEGRRDGRGRPGAFITSGTGIRTLGLVVDRPEQEEPGPFPTPAGQGAAQSALF